jgi:hypothetical protein
MGGVVPCACAAKRLCLSAAHRLPAAQSGQGPSRLGKYTTGRRSLQASGEKPQERRFWLSCGMCRCGARGRGSSRHAARFNVQRGANCPTVPLSHCFDVTYRDEAVRAHVAAGCARARDSPAEPDRNRRAIGPRTTRNKRKARKARLSFRGFRPFRPFAVQTPDPRMARPATSDPAILVIQPELSS